MWVNLEKGYKFHPASGIPVWRNGMVVGQEVFGGPYRRVKFRRKTYSVHRVVAETFIPNPHNKPVVNHKDGNKYNNKVSNLEWVTYSENTKHAHDTGLMPKKLTPKQVLAIRKSKKKWPQLSEKYKVSVAQIKRIINRDCWKNI